MRARGPSERDRWVCNADDLPPAHLWRTNRLKIQSLSLLRLTDSQSTKDPIRSVHTMVSTPYRVDALTLCPKTCHRFFYARLQSRSVRSIQSDTNHFKFGMLVLHRSSHIPVAHL